MQNETAQTALDVIVIGAGFAGVCMGIKLREQGITNFQVLEKHDDVGGTWYANTYPGATCDIPSHFYSFSFAPNPDWSRLYSPQPEILEYIRDCVERFGLRPHLRMGQEVSDLVFDETSGLWDVRLTSGETLRARFVVNGMGGLHRPSWPDIPGRDGFRGVTMHTALWDHDFDPKGKTIAVIGSAASAIQVIPKLAKTAARVDVYQRTPNYISPRGDFAYSERQKRVFKRFPVWQRLYRWFIMKRLDVLIFPLVHSTKRRDMLSRRIGAYLAKAVKDPDLRRKLSPDYELGCKRILVSDDFYAALKRSNVDLITDPIDQITPAGVATVDGAERPVDAIVFATGFDIQGQFTALNVTGRAGLTLREAWQDKVEAYRGVMVAGFPNYFQVTGPNSGVGTTSVVFMIEQSVRWILGAMGRVADGKAIEVTQDAQDRFNAELHADLSTTVWATTCSSWYKRDDGRIETLYPGSAAAYAREMRSPDDRDLTYRPISA
ncbi:flavin-containing monooxygenase [Arenibacterium sp. CAU 1754]